MLPSHRQGEVQMSTQQVLRRRSPVMWTRENPRTIVSPDIGLISTSRTITEMNDPFMTPDESDDGDAEDLGSSEDCMICDSQLSLTQLRLTQQELDIVLSSRSPDMSIHTAGDATHMTLNIYDRRNNRVDPVMVYEIVMRLTTRPIIINPYVFLMTEDSVSWSNESCEINQECHMCNEMVPCNNHSPPAVVYHRAFLRHLILSDEINLRHPDVMTFLSAIHRTLHCDIRRFDLRNYQRQLHDITIVHRPRHVPLMMNGSSEHTSAGCSAGR